MAIVKTDPQDFSNANVLLVDSDAATNRDAIMDIDRWAAENGLIRTNEYWLQQIFRGGKRYFRGICMRLTDELAHGAEELNRQADERLERMPVFRRQAD